MRQKDRLCYNFDNSSDEINSNYSDRFGIQFYFSYTVNTALYHTRKKERNVDSLKIYLIILLEQFHALNLEFNL